MAFSGCPHAGRTDKDPHITVWVWEGQGHAQHACYTCHINLDAAETNAVGVTIWDRRRGPVPFVIIVMNAGTGIWENTVMEFKACKAFYLLYSFLSLRMGHLAR